MNHPFDAQSLLRKLSMRGVDFVVIGGIAGVLHGAGRNTFDLDICFSSDPTNLDVLGSVLIDLEATLAGVPEDLPFVPDGRTLRAIEVLTMDTIDGRLDVLRRPAGAPPYAELRRNADRFDFGEFVALVSSLDDLIAMKRAAGRAKDLAALEELEEIRRRRGAA